MAALISSTTSASNSMRRRSRRILQKDPSLKELLPQLADSFATLDEFTHDSAEASLREFADQKGVKAGLLINATRTALTGQAVGPGLFDLVAAIGKDRTRRTIEACRRNWRLAANNWKGGATCVRPKLNTNVGRPANPR